MAFTITQETHKLDRPILQALTSTGVSTALHVPGYIVRSTDGREYKYIKFDSSGIVAVAGAPCAVAQTEDPNVITADLSDGTIVAVGCFLSILVDTYHGWIQTLGRAVDCPVSGSGAEVNAGEPLGATTDQVWSFVTVGGTTAEKAIARMDGVASTTAYGHATIEIIK